MTANRRRAWLSALEGRTAQLPTKDNTRPAPVETKLRRLTAQAYASYMMLRNSTLSTSQKTTLSTSEKTALAHQQQLITAVSFGVDADGAPEKLTESRRTELHQVFGPEHPGDSCFGYTAYSFQWHEDKHPDALALYLRLCAEEYL